MVEVLRVRGESVPCSICEGSSLGNSVKCEQCGKTTKNVCSNCARRNCPKCGKSFKRPPGFAERLGEAIEKGSVELIETELVGHERELDALVRGGEAPTFRSVKHESAPVAVAMTELFLKRGVPVDARNSAGQTALSYMVLSRPPVHRSVFELFSSVVNAQDERGRTALMLAAEGAGMFANRKGSTNAVRWLLDLGADVLAQDKRGWTALGYARKDNDKGTNEDMVALLEARSVEAVALADFRKRFKIAIDEKGVVHSTPKKPVKP